ncbi:MAG: M10 family metallopeptidase C-terminal domain-containing protein, partial [Xanthobacteraceae bacterium]
YVAGNNWSGAQSWTAWNDDMNIVDPSDKIIYEAHLYFDANHDGAYGSYTAEGANVFTGIEGMVNFVDWLDETGNQGFVGEFGVPSDDPRWIPVMSNFLSLLETAGISSTVWGGGPWWGDYDLSVEPVNGQDSPQMRLIADFLDGTAPASTASIGTTGDDVFTGDAGANFLYGRTGNDQLSGGDGKDILYGSSGDDLLDGGAGADKMVGGSGNDIYVVDNASDSVKELADEGIDLVKSSLNYTLGANVENLTLTGTAALSGTGNALDNVMIGNDGANKIVASTGNDTLLGGAGSDQLYGNDGDDILDGGLGADTLSGGNGADTYVFSSVAEANGDVVSNFVIGEDKFDVSAIDAKAGTAQKDAFTFVGTAAFSGQEGEMHSIVSGGKQYLEGDVNGDKVADFRIQVPRQTYTVSDFKLASDAPATPVPTDPVPTDPVPTNPVPTNPVPTDPVPTDPTPTEPVPTEPVPTPPVEPSHVFSAVAYALGAAAKDLTLTGSESINGTGNDLDNILTGNDGNNTLTGGNGNDTLYGGGGADALFGGLGADVLDGGLGADTLTGGDGADRFVFAGLSAADGDIVTDFKAGTDRLDLSGIDAKAGTAADDPFRLIGSAAFTGKEGDLRGVISGGMLVLMGDVNGDKVADFQIQMNIQTFTATDFIL